jgi:ribosome biogenesis GTPase
LNLEALGWSPVWAALLPFPLTSEQSIGRVAVAHADRAELLPAGVVFQPKTAADRLQVGDWVVVEGSRLLRRLPRKGVLSRRGAGMAGEPQIVATNLDVVFLTSSLNKDWNPARILRGLALVHACGAVPVVVATKCDLAIGNEGRFLRALPADLPVVLTSAHLGIGIEELVSHLAPGRTVALIGTSGTGKSSLMNALLGAPVMDTGEIRLHDDRGQHTTTRRELRVFDKGVLIDTPGMRELGITDSAGLDLAFADVVEAAAGCRYSDCGHEGDAGCAVVDAVASDRLEQWHKLQREAELEARRGDQRLTVEQNRVFKQRSRAAREREQWRGKVQGR